MDNGRISRDEMFIRVAHVVALRGTCPRARVGAVLVDKYHKIKSIGYNGNPPGHPHCDEVGCQMEDGHCKAIHAEVNALRYANFATGPYEEFDTGYTLYVTHKPCQNCMNAISKLSGYLTRVVYDVPYRYEGPDWFHWKGVLYERHKGPKM